MDVATNVSLRDYSTMRLGGTAAYLVTVRERREVPEALAWADTRGLPVLMIGGGSNIVWRDEGFAGLVIVNAIKRFEVQDEDAENAYITVGAGENWDETVARAVARNLTGIEGLSLIPGTAGATPVQNVGAYGQEIAQTLVSVEAYDREARQFVNLVASDCGFGYRTSRFKTSDRGRFFITAITLHLLCANPHPPFYTAVQAFFDEHGIRTENVTPQVLRDAVIAIRRARLPDPAVVANNGSFFANPIISEGQFAQLQADYPAMPHWPAGPGEVKVPAAWLLDQAGFKDFHDAATGMATWPAQPLVLVNEHARTAADLLTFKQQIVDKVRTQFGITLEQEPELLP